MCFCEHEIRVGLLYKYSFPIGKSQECAFIFSGYEEVLESDCEWSFFLCVQWKLGDSKSGNTIFSLIFVLWINLEFEIKKINNIT